MKLGRWFGAFLHRHDWKRTGYVIATSPEIDACVCKCGAMVHIQRRTGKMCCFRELKVTPPSTPAKMYALERERWGKVFWPNHIDQLKYYGSQTGGVDVTEI